MSDIHIRKKLYQALSVLEDSLMDSYKTNDAMPQFTSFDHKKTQVNSKAINDNLELLQFAIKQCSLCRLAASRSQTVLGQGPMSPLVMAIGEGPGEEEDRTGLPFVGNAGLLLDKMLESIGLSRKSNCYIANIVKCRPPLNRDPAPDEQEACLPFLHRQIAILNPKFFLALGRIPAQALLNTKESVGKLRGKIYDYQGRPLIVTYHPSALLRNETLKRPAWEDLKLLKSIISNDV